MQRDRVVIRLSVLLPVAGLLVACHATSPDAPGVDALGPSSPRTITERAVARVLGSISIPSGSRVASAAEARRIGPVETISSDNLVASHATYVVPLPTDQAIAWFAAHPPAGTASSGTSTGSSGGSVVTSGLTFDATSRNPAYDSLEAEVAARSFSDGSSLVRVDVEAVWLPAVTAERVPPGASSVRIVQVTAHRQTVRRATLHGPAVRRLARLINGQRAVSPGTYNCPNDTGAHDVVTFTGPWPDRRYLARAAGCPFIAVSVAGQTLPAALYGGVEVDRLVSRLLRTRR